MEAIKKIEIIGRGNVATHLKTALKDFDVNIINPHTLENLDREADLILISVKDSAIKEVFDKIGETAAILAHTSGSTPMNILKNKNIKYGVFYPLQTFSKDVPLDYSKIPFFIEGVDKDIEDTLKNLALHISDSVYCVDSDKRKVLHVASVFACNFANHLWGAANQILSNNNIPFSVVIPLVEETLRKAAESKNPYNVQTGPAVRGDNKIISDHLLMLSEYPALQKLYSTLSDSIQHIN